MSVRPLRESAMKRLAVQPRRLRPLIGAMHRGCGGGFARRVSAPISPRPIVAGARGRDAALRRHFGFPSCSASTPPLRAPCVTDEGGAGAELLEAEQSCPFLARRLEPRLAGAAAVAERPEGEDFDPAGLGGGYVLQTDAVILALDAYRPHPPAPLCDEHQVAPRVWDLSPGESQDGPPAGEPNVGDPARPARPGGPRGGRSSAGGREARRLRHRPRFPGARPCRARVRRRLCPCRR